MIGDTIYAVASPPGAGSRGILRLSGPEARTLADRVLAAPCPTHRAATEALVTVMGHRVPCLVLTMPAPHSYTGEDVVELHLPGSPVLLDEVCHEFATPGRLATPGEFTRRAFENGRLDLAAAEAVLLLIHAADVEESRFAVDVLRGGLAASVDEMRRAIQDGLALLEAGLDFTDGETGTVAAEQWLPGVRRARAKCRELRAALPPTGVHGEVILLGAANAGKSSLVNALVAAGPEPAEGAADVDVAAGGVAARRPALVAAVAGTTRDVLGFELAPGLRLLDAPGDLGMGPSGRREAAALAGPDRSALTLRDRLLDGVAGAIEVVDATAPRFPPATPAPVVARVYTKTDLQAPPPAPAAGAIPSFAVSNVTGAGVDALRAFLLRSIGSGHHGLRSRLHDTLGSAMAALDRAVTLAASGHPEELMALELGIALADLDKIHGHSSPEDLLDRIFAGFCLGK